LLFLGLAAAAVAQPLETPSYKGYAVAVTKAERRGNVEIWDDTARAKMRLLYFPSSWKSASWLHWDRDAEEIRFNKKRTKATKQYLFRVDEHFDRSAATLTLDDQVVTLSFAP
jgi:hypothetical protein